MKGNNQKVIQKKKNDFEFNIDFQIQWTFSITLYIKPKHAMH